jgi:hypothetical protein
MILPFSFFILSYSPILYPYQTLPPPPPFLHPNTQLKMLWLLL